MVDALVARIELILLLLHFEGLQKGAAVGYYDLTLLVLLHKLPRSSVTLIHARSRSSLLPVEPHNAVAAAAAAANGLKIEYFFEGGGVCAGGALEAVRGVSAG